MVEKECLDCGTLGRPKHYHPSSLRTEVTVWIVALAVGAGAGVTSLFTSAGPAPKAPELQRMALSVVGPSEAVPAPVAQPEESSTSGGTGLRFAVWARDLALDFLRVAWWVLPIPVLFSLWRQVAEREGCAHCRSGRLIPVDAGPGVW